MAVTPLLPGDPVRLGAHRLVGRLGQGGMGTVFLGVGPGERAVAVKVLREGVSPQVADVEGRRRFRRELEVLRRVRGPHLVEVLDGNVDADTPWIVTRYVPGRRLDEHVASSGPLPFEELRRVGAGIAEGLSALHAAGVVHRDLTPGNVLLLDGEPYVIDLGLAVVADVTAYTGHGLVVGTTGYLAPEQVLGHGCTEAVDVHAWGATLALAGTGRPPYGTGRSDAVLYRVVHAEPDLDGLPPALVGLVAAAMAKDPRERPALGQLLEALAEPDAVRALAGVSSGSQPTSDATTILPVQAPVQAPGQPEPDAGRTRVLRQQPSPGGTRMLPLPAPPRQRPDPNVPDEQRRLPGDLQAAVLALSGLALLGAAACYAPLLAAVVVLLALVLLHAVARSAHDLRDRRERRGHRGRDGVLAVAALPWNAVRALGALLLGLPVIALGAASGAGMGQALLRARTWESPPEAGVLAGAVVLATAAALAGRRAAPSRRLLHLASGRLVPTTGVAALVALVLLGVAAALLLGVRGDVVQWWPLESSPLS